MRTTWHAKLLFVLAAAWLAFGPSAAAQSAVPDLTQGGKPDDTHDWTLGPTGARGWIAAQQLTTLDARQILVTAVEKGSPADGVLEVGDVILGLGDKPFTSDARRVLGKAITRAEAGEGRGLLALLRWRKGKRGARRCTSRCSAATRRRRRKTARNPSASSKAAKYLGQHGLGEGLVAEVNALALLATGKPEYLDEVKSLAHTLGDPKLKLDLREGMCAWDWGATNLFLSQYLLATGDKYVLPAIREYSHALSQGQSQVGLWGHGMVVPGSEWGLGGYGAVNQVGLSCWLSLILAQQCGVDDDVVTQAVARSQRFFAFYVGKGSIPYGDHAPFHFLHDNNGKNAMAALAFDWLDEAPATRFFASMSAAAYDERELGHTGNYFGYLWGPLGVARAGEQALAAHLAEQRWFYDLARRWDGGFTYQGAPAPTIPTRAGTPPACSC
ncbi:MAG: hypothetical protein IPJ19_07825 [Planctomycetes bacterium]|nr:hypothetical protein [Planctomycetota bacterium]